MFSSVVYFSRRTLPQKGNGKRAPSWGPSIFTGVHPNGAIAHMDNLAKPQARGWTRLKDSCAMPSTAFCFSLARPANITLRMHSSFLRQPSTISCRSGTTATILRTRGIPARWPKSAHAMRAFLLQPNACSMALSSQQLPCGTTGAGRISTGTSHQKHAATAALQ